MNSIWNFLIQTTSVSVVALLLLFLKGIMADKLSPRWQYSVWCLLALRIIIPVASNQNIFLPVPIWVEMLKTLVESNLTSAYSSAFSVSQSSSVIPFITGIPQSITDWLMVIYALGVAVALLRYVVSYIRLRKVLKTGSAISGENVGQLNTVKLKYNLKGCKAVEVEGLSTAFVCGIFKPVLAIPKGTVLDEKIVLHELLHLKYKDNLLNVFWCILRSLHWCNPLLQYAFNRIGNDMESLCDQRVLERLEGEELRDYGKILLSMANNRFARAVGTTSVSNGGKNIKRRISAIVRFKKYPKGMEVVAFCIILVLLTPTVFGATSNYGDEIYNPNNKTELYRSMAYARVERCGTVAGALDTFARGVIYKNGLCVAIASPSDEQEKIYNEMIQNEDVRTSYYETIDGFELTNFYNKRELFYVINLKKISSKYYTACLGFCVKTDEEKEEKTILVCPVEITNADGWRVEMTGEQYVTKGFFDDSKNSQNHNWLNKYKGNTDYGEITVETVYLSFVDYEEAVWHYEWAENGDFDFENEPVSDVNLDADFHIDLMENKIIFELDTINVNCDEIRLLTYFLKGEYTIMHTGDLYISSSEIKDGKTAFECVTRSSPIDANTLCKNDYEQKLYIYCNGEETDSVVLERVDY